MDDWIGRMVECLAFEEVGGVRADEAITVKYQNRPQSIFKYRCNNEQSRHNLGNDFVWVCSPTSYNDPYDSSISIAAHTLTNTVIRERVRQFIERELGSKIDACKIQQILNAPHPALALQELIMVEVERVPPEQQAMFREPLAAQLKAWDEAFAKTLTVSHKDSLKVCSFSGTQYSIIMWSHYADQHRGFCIEYDTNSLPPENLFVRMLYPVIYSEKLFDGTKYYLAAMRNRATFNILFPALAALYKSPEWSYEKEWRLVIPANLVREALPLEDRKEWDIGLPVLTPSLVRKKSLAEEIAELDVMTFQSIVLPKSEDDPRAKTFTYEGYDIITLKKEVEREYRIPEPQTAQEVIGYYARRIAEAVKLPAQFASLAPKVRDFFEQKAFGHQVDLNDAAVVKAMSTPVAHYVCVDVFKKALQALTIEEQTPQLLEPARMLSACQPFPWSRPVWEGNKCVFNLVPCDNDFEREFAKFLDNADDVKAFAKLPRPFGFTIEYTDTAMNLRNYEPDFVAVDRAGTHWILEAKGQENVDVLRKDMAATRWCENASALTQTQWRFVKVPQKEFDALQPARLADLQAFQAANLI